MGSDRDSLRLERDRFVAFAFSAAELLLEVDERLTIRYAAGANSQLTGREASTLVGTPLIELFAETDRKFVGYALASLQETSRATPISVRLRHGDKVAILGACRLPSTPGHVFISLASAKGRTVHRGRGARDPQSGTWSKDEFSAVVSDLVQGGGEQGRDERLTLLELGGLEQLRQRMNEGELQALLEDTSAYLRARSLGGDAVGRLADDKYGIVHDKAVTSHSLIEALGAMSRAADPAATGLRITQHSLDLTSQGLVEEDIDKIVGYALQQFVDQGAAGFDIATLSQGFERLVKETAGRLQGLKQTVAQQSFHIAFQPIVTLADRSVHHYELLSRFPDASRPSDTVLFAEQMGLIEELDLAVCQFAINVIQERAKKDQALELAINISGRSLGSSIFTKLLGELLASLGRRRGQLLIELTETARLDKLTEANNFLQHLRALGHPICLDDFGSGEASFRYLQALTVDYVKVDGTFVHRLIDSPQDTAIIRSIVSLCRDLGVRTIGEMVETEGQAKELRALGIELAQGWLFGRPQFQIPTTSGGARRAALTKLGA